MCYLTSFLFFILMLDYHYFSVFVLDIYIYIYIYIFVYTCLSLSISFSFVSELLFGEVFETLVILSAILFQIKSLVASVFWIVLLEAVLSASLGDCCAWSINFCLYLLLKFLLLFLPIFLPIFSKGQKSITFYKCLTSWLK